MADSTTNLDAVGSNVEQKEVKFNALFDAHSLVSAFGRRAVTCSGLTWGYYGIGRWYINASATPKSNATLSLTASSTRYASVDRSLAMSEQATEFAADKLAVLKAVTGSATVTSYEDHRDPHHINRFLYGRFTLAMGGANKTLTYEQAMCESMELTGSSASLLDVIVPAVPRDWRVFANTSGGGGIRVKTASGTGITVADGKRAILECDGTNVVRVTADV
jgi:hypothetical protein